MALSVVKRPQPLRLTTTTGTATTSGTTITDVGHGLITGDYVYITDNEATGFWYVNKLTDDTFQIKEYPTASAYSFVGTASLTRTEVWSAPYFNAVHNPIVYKLSSTLWPTNSVDTARTVSSYSNDLGYAKLTLSGSLGTISELEFVKVTFTGGETAVYQVLTWYSNSIVTINLPYVGGLTFVSVQKYYTDYHAKIRVYAGLASSHTYANQKPYELLCEIKAVPDSDGIITVNINEYLKEKIDILSNDLNLGSLPNDINSFCQFYITYAEAYSYSEGGYTLLDYVGSYTDDSSNADLYAINASLPFKNIYSGWMSEYVFIASTYTLKFLTPMREPTLFAIQSDTLGPVSQFFDVSYIQNNSSDPTGSIHMKLDRYKNGVIVSSIFDPISLVGIGVYRYELDRSVYLEDRIDLTLVAVSSIESLSGFTNEGSGESWTLGATPSITTSASGVSKYLAGSIVGLSGLQVDFTINVTFTNGFLECVFLNSSFSPVGSTFPLVTGSQVESLTIPSGAAYFAFVATGGGPGDAANPTINSVTISTSQTELSETLTVMVDDSCSPSDNFIDLSWKNHLGGMDYWRFKSFSEYGVDILKTTEADKNFYPSWPNSWGEDADTLSQETSRESVQTLTVRAENLTETQVQDLFRIKLSPLVQIVNSRTDRRTVIPDKSSFVYFKEGEKNYSMTLTLTYTDKFPSQSL